MPAAQPILFRLTCQKQVDSSIIAKASEPTTKVRAIAGTKTLEVPFMLPIPIRLSFPTGKPREKSLTVSYAPLFFAPEIAAR